MSQIFLKGAWLHVNNLESPVDWFAQWISICYECICTISLLSLLGMGHMTRYSNNLNILEPRILCQGWKLILWFCGSGKEDIYILLMYLCYFLTISHWKRLIEVIWIPFTKWFFVLSLVEKAQWFWRIRWKCENFTMDPDWQQTNFYHISSIEPSALQGEQKIIYKTKITDSGSLFSSFKGRLILITESNNS